MKTTKNKFLIELQNASSSTTVPKRTQLRTWIAAVLEGRRNETELVIRIVDESESAELNESYRHKIGPTNVLSFPLVIDVEFPQQVSLLGDIVICAPVVEREALEQGKAVLSHWAHMVVHGTLHLLGYDHEQDQEAKKMESLEIEILNRLGFANPYAIYAISEGT